MKNKQTFYVCFWIDVHLFYFKNSFPVCILTVESTEVLARAYHVETERKRKIANLLQEYSAESKEFEALSLAWIQLVSVGSSEEEMLCKGINYEANLGAPWAL